MPENRLTFPVTKGFITKIPMKLAYQYVVIFFNFSTKSNHLHPLQVENWNTSHTTLHEHLNVVYKIINVTSGVCLAISLMSVATFFFTYSSESFRQVSTAGNISASTTISARSTECLAIWLNAENTWRWKRRKIIKLEHMKQILAISYTNWRLLNIIQIKCDINQCFLLKWPRSYYSS